MESLPPEIFDSIFTYVTSRSALLKLRAVNKFFKARFTPTVFRSLKFPVTDRGVARFDSIARSGLARWAVELIFVLSYGTYDGKYKDGAFRNVRAFSNVQSISLLTNGNDISFICDIDLVAGTPAKTFARNLYALQDMFFQSFVGKGQDTISPTSLTIQGLCLGGRHYFTEPGFQRRFGGLKYLSICPVNVSVKVLPRQHVGFELLMDDWLKPVQATLETLVLKTPTYITSMIVKQTSLKFSKLRKLELHQLRLSKGRGAGLLPLIVSEPIASTLEELVLYKCAIMLEEQGRTWVDVFLALRGLKRLRVLTLKPPLLYERERFYTSAWEEGLGHQEDERALNALREALGKRK